ncbi:hypothetical protein DLAC_04241 [Tieghemostelium lacteum]|uniref:Negative elongation factor B n=1 Tax=Tieghemostelium lacteum TaxID=361077 RepID=A0A151ZSB6_TIELA|nr:hypothetical protein DLAC_04241 [Tieghemostelium lacteum]|eukprot:KYQ96921.1 hypothetical protein DLAC_04241 [Tieghemostelium lacteum]
MEDHEHFLIGHLGGEQILTGLSQTTLPLQYIDQFQQNNGIDKSNLPTVTPVLKLLDLHQISRGSLYFNLFSLLKENLLTKVSQMNSKELEVLLEQTFPYIGFDELKAIPMTVMKRLTPNVPHVYLLRLAETLDLYEQCPIEVKRQIWLINEDLFRQRIEPLITHYLEDPHLLQDLNELLGLGEHLPSKRRESNTVLQELLQIIGKSPQLYNQLVDYIKKLYQETNTPALCTLRSEILMITHDHDIQEIYQTDLAHNFAWCMDACTKDQSMDVRRVKEIQMNFNSLSNNSPTLVDISMVFANPLASNALVTNIIHQLRDVVKRKQTPKDDDNIKYLTFLLTLATKSTEMIRQSKYKIPHAKKPIFQQFYPILVAQIQDDVVRDQQRLSSMNVAATVQDPNVPPPPGGGQSLGQSTSSTNLMSSSSGGTTGGGTTQQQHHHHPTAQELEVDSALDGLYQKYDIVRMVMLTYIVKRISEKDTLSVDKYLKFLSGLVQKYLNVTLNSNNQATNPDIDYSAEIYNYFSDDFIQSIVTQLINVKDQRMNTVVIDGFLLKYRSAPYVHKQLLRYLLEFMHKMNQRDLVHFVTKLYTLPSTSSILLSSRDKKIYEEIVTMSKILLDKSNARLSEKNVPLLFEFLKSKSQQQQQQQQVQSQQQSLPQPQETPLSSESPSSNVNAMDVDQQPSSSSSPSTSAPTTTTTVSSTSPSQSPSSSSSTTNTTVSMSPPSSNSTNVTTSES